MRLSSLMGAGIAAVVLAALPAGKLALLCALAVSILVLVLAIMRERREAAAANEVKRQRRLARRND